MAARPDAGNGDFEDREEGRTPSRFNPFSLLSSTPRSAQGSTDEKTPIKQRIMGAVMGSAVEIMGSALPRSVKSSKTRKRIKDAPTIQEEEIQRLNEENLALTAELSMWKGRCKALTRACEQMDTVSTTYPPHAASIREAGVSASSRNLFRLFSDPLSPRSESLKAARSPGSLLLVTPANMMMSPQQDPAVPPDSEIPEMGAEVGAMSTAEAEPDACAADADTEKLIRRPPARSLGSFKRDSGSFKYRDEGMFTRSSSGRFQLSPEERSGKLSPTSEAEDRFFEHIIHFGVGNNSAPLFWEDQRENMAANGEGGEVVVGCIPEQLWCFPSTPPVLELEQFVFPQQVLVQREADDTWRELIQKEGAKTSTSDGGAAGVEGIVRAVEEGIYARQPPGTGQPEAGKTAGQAAGVTKLVFVLSTKEKGGEPLYGVCLYWDEPCALMQSLEGGAGGAQGLELIKSRHGLCLLTRYPMLAIHEEVLSIVIRQRAHMVASRMAAVLGEGVGEGPTDSDASFGVKDWWGVGTELGPEAEQLLMEFYDYPLPGGGRDGPLSFTLSGLPFTLRLAPQDTYCRPEAAALRFGLSALMGHLSMPTIITTVHALLLERRLVVQCSDLFLLSAIAMVLPWLVRPFKWQTHFIPFLPPCLLEFLHAPVPYIAGVLAQPPAGYEDDVVVLHVEADTVIGGERVPRKAELTELVAKLVPPHNHLSEPGTPPWTRQCRPCDAETKREVRHTIRKVMEGSLSILASTVSGLISLPEIRGHCIAGRDLVSGEVLTKETKMSYLKTISHEERAFMGELLDTQLFASYFMQRVSEWFTTGGDKLDGDSNSVSALAARLAQSKAALARREEEMRGRLRAKDEEIARLRRHVAELEGGGHAGSAVSRQASPACDGLDSEQEQEQEHDTEGEQGEAAAHGNWVKEDEGAPSSVALQATSMELQASAAGGGAVAGEGAQPTRSSRFEILETEDGGAGENGDQGVGAEVGADRAEGNGGGGHSGPAPEKALGGGGDG